MHPSEYIHLIIKCTTPGAALREVNSRTAGIFGNVKAFEDGEKVENCMPAVCCQPHVVNGWSYLRVAIDPAYETLWPVGKYDTFEIMLYAAWNEHTDSETGEVTFTPNREPYNCGDVTFTDEDGTKRTQAVMMGGWGI